MAVAVAVVTSSSQGSSVVVALAGMVEVERVPLKVAVMVEFMVAECPFSV